MASASFDLEPRSYGAAASFIEDIICELEAQPLSRARNRALHRWYRRLHAKQQGGRA